MATLKYKLKLKDIKNEELLEKEIATNEKVVLTYTDSSNSEKEVILGSSPKIKLAKIIEQKENEDNGNKREKEENEYDKTISGDKELPNTGKIVFVWAFVVISISAIVANIRYKKLYK